MSTNDRLGSRLEVRLAVLGAVLVALLGTLFTTTTAPASAATVMKSSTRCVGTAVKRCVYLEAYWVNGERKVRAVAKIRTDDAHTGWVDHVSLYRNSHRVTTRYWHSSRGS